MDLPPTSYVLTGDAVEDQKDGVTIDEIMANTDELGRAKIEAAVTRIITQRQLAAKDAELAELRKAFAEQENAKNERPVKAA